MKSLFFILFTVYLLSGFAAVYTVSNSPNTDPDFSSLSAAHTAAQPGDTLYVCASPTSYGDINITKKLTLIGPGYFLQENPQTQVGSLHAMINQITFGSGANESLVTGLQINKISVNSSDITIARNYIKCTEGSSYHIINIGWYYSNIVIMQNYFYYNYEYNNNEGLIKSGAYNNGLLISNNILLSYEGANLTIDSRSSATIENNVILGGTSTLNNSIFQNNIVISGAFVNGSGNQIRHNLANLEQFGSENGNQSNIDMNTVFTYTGSTDGKYSLLPTSPAVGAGLNGVDCGAYGGASPYVLSGMPANIPSIYEVQAPSTGFVLPLGFKAAAH